MHSPPAETTFATESDMAVSGEFHATCGQNHCGNACHHRHAGLRMGLLYEILMMMLMERLGETAETMRTRHTNLE